MSFKTESWAVYCKAHRAGKREVHRSMRKGTDPYLRVLNGFLDDGMISDRIPLGVMDIPTDKIVGIAAEEKKELFSFDFLPLAAPDGDHASKWCKLYWYYLSNNGVRCPITCYEYMGRFYVIDGIKRVSIAKCHGLPTMAASVTRIMPVRTQDKAVLHYFDCVKCYDQTGLYQIEFSRPGSFAQFQKSMGFAPDYRWNEADRLDFLFNWYNFEGAFREAFNNYLNITPADAFLVFMEEYPYDRLREMPPMVLVQLLRKSWKKLYALHNTADLAMDAFVDPNQNHSVMTTS